MIDPERADLTILAGHRAVMVERAALRPAASAPICSPADRTGLSPPSRLESVIANAPKRPVETAVREHVRAIGWELYAQGGFDGMEAVWNQVAAECGRAAAWLDKAWDGIEGWHA